jgi:hypothetical protein
MGGRRRWVGGAARAEIEQRRPIGGGGARRRSSWGEVAGEEVDWSLVGYVVDGIVRH